MLRHPTLTPPSFHQHSQTKKTKAGAYRSALDEQLMLAAWLYSGFAADGADFTLRVNLADTAIAPCRLDVPWLTFAARRANSNGAPRHDAR